ncbi:DUF3383 family protein [Bacillus atrophaeus]|uniref:DUF3383 family protein n=1 Tax=Bacillus atrophaeus TaxID=1452 RepID=UPI00227E7D7E|nr:DUF3383 family protein [Bacillus atrophaeus]MCY8813677.1 DUF3383 domain-containing protein [Bacillus atrophaeus]MCY8820250.1 DUF3383 domain-containing protein [Bacillus atrophaeus]MCY8828626.1 DUF3383 domain-containing protein [Bacillus atrophaeus]MCY8832713.1 DUF3383 domain-containing protein [Bacillus atrophaeus]MEC0749753.1 DUF3383 family protein [Bacillus atrophaeus]
MPLSDVKVTIDLVKPSTLIGLGVPLILVKNTSADSVYREYGSLEALKQNYPESSATYKKAAAIYAQGDYAPHKIAVASFGKETPGDGKDKSVTKFSVRNALEEYFDKDFHFVLLAAASADDRLEASKYFEEKAYKFLVLKVTDEAEITSYKGKDRTIVFYHPLTDEEPDAALVGAVSSRTVGSVTWKFKTLVSITPQDYKADQIANFHKSGAIVYVTKAGINQTSEGITASGEYIDVLHGKDWVKLNIETSIQAALSNSGKIPFSNEGFSLLESQVTNVLLTAFTNGIIAGDEDGQPIYTVKTKKRSEISDENRNKRLYDGLSFSFELAQAVHEANITGEIIL